MSEYLINPICKFIPLRVFNQNQEKNILSTCFFKMGKHYKNFDTYIKGLKRLINLVNSQSKYILKIFIDEHIKNDNQIYPILKSSKNVYPILFTCPNHTDDSNYHIDVFGALIRLFPIFDFEHNNSENVIVIDIDLNYEDIMKLKILMEYNFGKREIIGMGISNNLLITKYTPHFFCGLFGVFGVKFDKSIILNFIANAPKILDKGIYGKRLKPFGYGTDELFLNEYFIYYDKSKYIKDIKTGMIILNDINWFLYHYKNELLEDEPKKTYKCLKFILGKYFKPNFTSNEMFMLIDKLTYHVKSLDESKIYISERYYKLIRFLVKKNIEWFDKKQMKLIDKYLYGIVDCMGVFYFNPINLEVNEILVLKKNLI